MLVIQKRNSLTINTTNILKLTSENFASRLAKANLVTKADFDNTLASVNTKITSNKTKHLVTESVLQQKTIAYNHKKVVNLYIVYGITNFHGTNNYHTLTNALFGAVKLTKNAEIGKYKYSGCGIALNGHGFYSYPSGGTGRNVIIFGVNMSSSSKIDNK